MSVPLPRSSEADVAANREARITGSQLLDLWYSGLWRLLIGLPIAGIAVALSWGPPLPSIPVANFFVMAMGIGFLGYGTYLSWRGFSFIGDALTRRVTYVTGVLGREEEIGYRGAKYYYMVVGPVKTLLYRRSTYEAVPVGVRCHAYYVPGSGHLLSLEPATAEEPHPSLRFGRDPTHAWDRLRWSWLLAAVAAYGLAAGVYATITAHPARTVLVSGRMSEYHVVIVTSKGTPLATSTSRALQRSTPWTAWNLLRPRFLTSTPSSISNLTSTLTRTTALTSLRCACTTHVFVLGHRTPERCTRETYTCTLSASTGA